MDKRQFLALLVVLPTLCFGCSHKEQTTSNSSSSEGAATTETVASPLVSAEPQASIAAYSSVGKTLVTFNFTDVAVTTSGAPLLRLGFDMKNGENDPLLCDPSEFLVQLADGSTIAADAGAEDTCTPDTVDPGATGKVVMFFDLKNAYSGPVTLLMSVNNAVVGRGSTDGH